MAESKDEQTRKTAGQPQRRPKVDVSSEILELGLSPELLMRATAAAKACGQTPSEWICEAVAEVIERKSKAIRTKHREQ